MNRNVVRLLYALAFVAFWAIILWLAGVFSSDKSPPPTPTGVPPSHHEPVLSEEVADAAYCPNPSIFASSLSSGRGTAPLAARGDLVAAGADVYKVDHGAAMTRLGSVDEAAPPLATDVSRHGELLTLHANGTLRVSGRDDDWETVAWSAAPLLAGHAAWREDSLLVQTCNTAANCALLTYRKSPGGGWVYESRLEAPDGEPNFGQALAFPDGVGGGRMLVGGDTHVCEFDENDALLRRTAVSAPARHLAVSHNGLYMATPTQLFARGSADEDWGEPVALGGKTDAGVVIHYNSRAVFADAASGQARVVRLDDTSDAQLVGPADVTDVHFATRYNGYELVLYVAGADGRLTTYTAAC